MDSSDSGIYRAQRGRCALSDREFRLQVRAEGAAPVELCPTLPERAHGRQRREGLLPEMLQKSTAGTTRISSIINAPAPTTRRGAGEELYRATPGRVPLQHQPRVEMLVPADAFQEALLPAPLRDAPSNGGTRARIARV